MIKYKEWTIDEFSKDINTITRPILRPAEDVAMSQSFIERYITYLVPVPVNHPQPYGTVIFQIKENTLREMLLAIMKERGGNAIILDDQGRIVTSLAKETQPYESVFAELNQSTHHTGSRELTLNNTSYLLSYVKSESSGWTYMTFIPEEVLMDTVNKVKNQAMISLLIIIVLGGFVIYYVMHLNYDPLKQLIRSAETKWGRAIHTFRGFDTVKNAMTHMEGIHQELSEMVQSSQPVMRQQMLMNLLKGRYSSNGDFSSRSKDLGIDFPYKAYYVMIIGLEKSDEEISMHARKHVEEWLISMDQSMRAYHVDVFDESRMTWICNSEITNFPPSEHLNRLRQALSLSLPCSFTIGVGHIHEKLNQIGKSYMEAVTAIDYRFIKGNDHIICIEDVASVNVAIPWYPSAQLEQLTLLIRQGDIEKIKDTVYSIISKIKEHSATLFMARCLSYDLMNTIMKTMMELNQDWHKEYPDVLSLTEIHTADKLAEVVTRVCVDACENMQGNTDRDSLHVSMLAYIHQHYRDPQFTIGQIAEHLHMSSSYISRYFKEQTNRTIWDYVNQSRIEQAMVLLKTTDDPLQEVVNQIGYNDVSSFIRRFKQLVKMTPGEYRKLFEDKKT